MKNKLYIILGGLIGFVLAITGTVFASTVFYSNQLAPNPSNGNCLQSDGTNNTWTSCGGGGTGSGTVSTSTPLVNTNVDFSTGVSTIGNNSNFTFLTGNTFLGIGSSTPGTRLSLGNTGANTINISDIATSTFGTGINLRTGCFALNGTCIGSGSTTLTNTTEIWIDGNSVLGTQNGTIQFPYHTIGAAIQTVPAIYHIAPISNGGVYSEGNLTFTATSTFEGNQATILVNGGTGTIKFNTGFVGDNMAIVAGNIILADPALSDPSTFSNSFIQGNLTMYGLSVFIGGELTGGSVYTEPNSLTNLAGADVLDTIGVAGTINLDDDIIQPSAANAYAIQATTTGSSLRLASIQLSNTASNGGGIYCANGATTAANSFAVMSILVGTTTNSGAFNCGSATTFVGQYAAFSSSNGSRLYADTVNNTNLQPYSFGGLDVEGNVGIGSTTATFPLSIGNNWDFSGTATSTGQFGLNIQGGCFAIGGLCINTSGSSSGSGGGTFATTTSQVPTINTNHPIVNSDIITSGSNSTTTASLWIDPNTGVLVTTPAEQIKFGTTTAQTVNFINDGTFRNTGKIAIGNMAAIDNSSDSVLLNIQNQDSTTTKNSVGESILEVYSPASNNNFYQAATVDAVMGYRGANTAYTPRAQVFGATLYGSGDAGFQGPLGESVDFLVNPVDTGHLSGTAVGQIYGMSIENLGHSATSTSAGIHIEPQDKAFGILQDNGYSIFGGQLSVGTSTPGVLNAGGTNVLASTTIPLSQLTIATTSVPQLGLSAGAGLPQWTFRNAGGTLYFATTTVAGTATSSVAALTIGSNGKIVANCFSTDGSTCISGSGGSGTVGIGLAGQIPYYASGGNTVTATSSITIAPSSGDVGFGTTTPQFPIVFAQDNGFFQWQRSDTSHYIGDIYTTGPTEAANWFVGLNVGDSNYHVFNEGLFADSIVAQSTTNNIGISSSTPNSLLSVGSTNGINFSTATSTFNSTGGIDLEGGGCFSISGVCLPIGGSSVTGSAGQNVIIGPSGSALATSSIFILPNGFVGISTTTPNSLLSLGSGTGIASTTRGGGLSFGDIVADLYRSAAGVIETDGTINFKGSATISGATYASTGGTVLKLQGSMGGTANDVLQISNPNNLTNTTGTMNETNITAIGGTGLFKPISGGGVFNALNINPTINQITSAVGISRGIYDTPIITTASDFRALEIAPYTFNLNESTTTLVGVLENPFTVASTTATTVTNAYEQQIFGAPIASTNVTISTSTALQITGGAVNGGGTVSKAFGAVIQAPTGATNNYAAAFGGDIQTFGTTTPILSSCGTNPSIRGTDTAGEITVGSVTAAGCTMQFATSKAFAPACTITNQGMSVVNAMTYTVSTTGFVVSQTGLTGDKLDYQCTQLNQ